MIELVGVGHSCQDLLCVVEDYPPEDGSTHIIGQDTQGGGAVATALAAAARMGIRTGYIGTLGLDPVGEQIVQGFAQEGVDLSGVTRRQDVLSLSSYVMVHAVRGTRTKFPCRDRMPPIPWEEHQRQLLCGARMLHLDGTHYQNAWAAAQLAKKSGVLISLDGCSRQSDNSLNRQLASMADLLLMNAAYPCAVTGLPTLEAALLEMSTWGPQVVLSTAGARGLYAVVEGQVRHFPAYPVPKAVDTTGAGDVFHGAFLAAHLRGGTLEECIGMAQYAAAVKCGQMGGRQGIPDWDTVVSGWRVDQALPASIN